MMAKVLLFVCLLSGLSLAISKEVHFSNCEGVKTIGILTELEIILCPKEPCVLKRGSDIVMKAHFKLNKNVTDAHAEVHAKVSGFWIPWQPPHPDACKDSGLTCPLQAGGAYIYTSKLHIKKEFPKFKTVVKWELQDTKSEQDIFCFEISVQIV